jgi:Domain of unknown function (DUF4383)
MIKKLGLLWGFLFLLGGILGFVPGITRDEMFLGFFMVNTPHNILHIASGIIFLIAAMMGVKAVRSWFIIFGLFYAALSAIGFVVGNGLIFNLISNSKIDSWGHGFLGLVLFLTGFTRLRCPCRIIRNRAPAGENFGCSC